MRLVASLTGFCSVLLLTATVLAQGTAEDYKLAQALRHLTDENVLNARLVPHWMTNSNRFWYRHALPAGASEFVLINGDDGARQPLFDHQRLATALAHATGKPVAPDHLPLEQLEIEEGAFLAFHADARRWRCDLRTFDLRQEIGDASALIPLPAPEPSRQTGRETSLTFINHTDGDVLLFWIDTDGDARPYGSVAAHGQRRQHTYTGHVWLVRSREGALLAVYKASEAGGTAPIPAAPPAQTDAPVTPAPSAQPEPAGTTSPDGKWLALFKQSNLYVRAVPQTNDLALSTDGTAENEYSGDIWWAPDSTRLVVLQTRKGDDRKVYYVESAPKDQLQPKLHSYAYLKPGDRIPLPKPRLFDVAERRSIPVPDDLFPNPWSIEEMHWAPDSSRFTFLYNQRGHQVLRVIAVDAKDGVARALVDEQSSTFIDYAGKRYFNQLDDSGEIIWMSERDGWNHLYLYDARNGRLKNQITRGPWVIRDVVRVDPKTRQVWFRAGGIRAGQDPYYVQYGRVAFDGTGLTILTEGDGNHSVTFSSDASRLVDTWSRVDLPPVHELRRASDGSLICELDHADWSALLTSGWRPPERLVAKGRDGKTDIYGILLKPAHFDPNNRYPVIEDIYAGPQSAFVPKAFSTLQTMESLAALGFVLVKMDGMGTSHRSKAFHDVCWKNLGDSGFPDRIAWIKTAAAARPWMNLNRVGIYGGSAGGQSSTRALLAHGDFYRVAVSDCGCHDNRMDKIWWNELWMGWPVGPEYAEQSNVTQASRLQGKLLLIVGEMDENVDPSSTMQVVNALIKADKDFDLLVMTGKGHGAAENDYGWRRRADYFVRNLWGAEPRR